MSTRLASAGPTLAELDRLHEALSDEERVNLLEELLVACSSGWPQVVSLLESRALDHKVREAVGGLRESKLGEK